MYSVIKMKKKNNYKRCDNRFDLMQVANCQVPRMQAAFTRWIATLTLCIKNSMKRRTIYTAMMRSPRSLKNAAASLPRAPCSVSTAMG